MDILSTLGAMALLGAGCAGMAYLLAARRLRTAPSPMLGAVVRLRGPSGVYRTRLEGIELGGWRLAAPLQRDRHVPLRVGESLIVEAPTGEGAYLYRTHIVERDAAGHTLLVTPPVGERPIERRRHSRLTWVEGQATAVDGRAAEFVDLSAGGARLRTAEGATPGDCVRVRLHGADVDAWVLDHAPAEGGARFPWQIRVCFVEDLPRGATRV